MSRNGHRGKATDTCLLTEEMNEEHDKQREGDTAHEELNGESVRKRRLVLEVRVVRQGNDRFVLHDGRSGASASSAVPSAEGDL